MPTRYQLLRQAVATLAAPAEEQARYLDDIFTSLTGGGSAAGYGNNELALELDDILHAADDMTDHGELTQAEKEAIQPWAVVRICAARTLARLPDEERAIGRCA